MRHLSRPKAPGIVGLTLNGRRYRFLSASHAEPKVSVTRKHIRDRGEANQSYYAD